jgi:hypothetical protein
MAEKAEFYVKKSFKDGFQGFKDGFQVVRKLQDGIEDINRTCTLSDEEMVPISDAETSLVIKAPPGTDLKECWVKVRADVDLSIVLSRSNAYWAFKIIPGSSPPEAPTTVNVTIGEDET